MKKLFCLSLLLLFSFQGLALSPRTQIRRAINLIEKGNYTLGSRELYRLSRLKTFKSRRPQIKYTLSLAFIEMKLYHLASIQLIYVIKYGKRADRRKGLEKMSAIMDHLGDDDLLYYIVTEIKESEFPISHKDKLQFYSGVSHFNKKNYRKARYHFSKVKSNTPFYSRALYYRALSYAEQNKVSRSVKMFKNLIALHPDVTDENRSAGLIGLARVLYQASKFDQSISVYRSIPRDSKYFHDALLENGWNFLRSGKFRSALSNFQTLHSSFYQGFYQPESLIVRSYIYLYICKYYEMEKVLNLFNALHIPILKEINKSLRWKNLYKSYYTTIANAQALQAKGESDTTLSPIIFNRVIKHPQFKAYSKYIQNIEDERIIIDNLPSSWKRDRVGRNARYILNSRINTTQKLAGKVVRSVLLDMKKDLKKLSTSEQYLRYDMLRGKRESIKKRIARKYGEVENQIDHKVSRSYYIQNGYEYWPFDGEYWLDEIGNYHYLGKHECSQ